MSLPLKRKRESSRESSGTAARSSSNPGRGGHTGRGNGNNHAPGRRRSRGRGRSFHIPSRNASHTVILTEVWKHRAHGTYSISSQLGSAPPSSPTSHPTAESQLGHQPLPDALAEPPQPLHRHTNANRLHNVDNFLNSSEYQGAQSNRPQKVDCPNGPLRQTHQNKRRNQASTWMEQVIPLLFGPFMDLLRRTQSGRASISPPAPNDDTCSCSLVPLKVTCVSWDCWYSSCSTRSRSNHFFQVLKTGLSLPVTVAQLLSN